MQLSRGRPDFFLSRCPPSKSNSPARRSWSRGTVVAIQARRRCEQQRQQTSKRTYRERVCGCVASCARKKVGRLPPGRWVGWSGLEQLATHQFFLFSASGAAQRGLADHQTSAHAWAGRMPQRLGWVFRLAHPGRGIFRSWKSVVGVPPLGGHGSFNPEPTATQRSAEVRRRRWLPVKQWRAR